MSCESFGEFRFNLGRRFNHPSRSKDGLSLSNGLNSLIISSRGFECYISLLEIMSCESFGDFKFNFGCLLLGQRRDCHFEMALTHLLLVLEVRNAKVAYRNSCLVNLLMSLNLTLGASFKIKGGFIVLMALTHLLSVLEVQDVKLAHRKCCLVNLLMSLNLTMGASFKVKGGSIIFNGLNSLIISYTGLD